METNKPKRLVSLIDTAVDFEAMGQEAVRDYMEKRDFSLVKEVAGKKLTVFHVRRIPVSLYQSYVSEAPSEQTLYTRAFQVSVVRIDNLVDMDGKTHARIEPTEERHTPRGPVKVWSERELELIAPSFLEEIGSIANVMSRLPPGNELTFQPPRSLLDDLAARMVSTLRHAAGQSTSPASTKSKAKARPAKKRSKGGGARTAATATEKVTES